jgi:hypothetical protein
MPKADDLKVKLMRAGRRAQLAARDSDELRNEVVRALKNKNRRERADWLLEAAWRLGVSGDYLSRRSFERAKEEMPGFARGVHLPAGARARARER